MLCSWSSLQPRAAGGRGTNRLVRVSFPRRQQPVETEVMHLSSSKSRVILAPLSRGPDACEVTARAPLGQDAAQRTVLGVLTENGQYRKTCGQVMTRKSWGSRVLRRAVLPWCSFTYKLSLSILPGIWTMGTLNILRSSCQVRFPATNSE